jgi:hypothetical protein
VKSRGKTRGHARVVCVCVVCVLDESTQVDEKQLLGR